MQEKLKTGSPLLSVPPTAWKGSTPEDGLLPPLLRPGITKAKAAKGKRILSTSGPAEAAPAESALSFQKAGVLVLLSSDTARWPWRKAGNAARAVPRRRRVAGGKDGGEASL